ncbi:hypothetical protein QCA50_006881 [Cerrena zonata]|uniref:Uncharacterized protein n=1 Tax=Cerrena zonata TaxID=2478898 RepID=A0AAW0GJ04_9APHY
MVSIILDPDLLQKLKYFQLSNYMTIAGSALWVYDFSLGIAEEARIFSRSLKPPDIVYITSRVLLLGQAALGLALIIIPDDACVTRNLSVTVEWIVAFSVPCNTWIFFTRVRAVYNHSRIIQGVFFVLWALTLIALGTPFTYEVPSIPLGNGLCLRSLVFHRHFEAISLSALTLFDTAVMIAISIRMMSYSLSDTWKSKVYSLVFGNEMGHTSRLFLQSSQIYYFSLVGIQLAYLGTLLSPSIPDEIVVMVALFQAMFHNIMICRVYRMMKLDSGSPSDNVPSYVTPIAFDLNDALDTQDSTLFGDRTIHSSQPTEA